MARSIVFLSDYGLADEFVGVCHGVIAAIAPDARVIDLTHHVPRHDVRRGATILARAAPFMPPDAVHLAVVDPGVGTGRRAVAVEAVSGALLVGPDNGVLSLAWEALGGVAGAAEVASDAVLRRPVSRTFHGRDVFAPAAAHLAAGLPVAEVGPPVDAASLVRLARPEPRVEPGRVTCEVVAVDGFGNAQLNVRAEHLEAAGLTGAFRLGHRLVRVVGTFGDVEEGDYAAVIDSQGYLALFVNRGSAARVLGIEEGDVLTLE